MVTALAVSKLYSTPATHIKGVALRGLVGALGGIRAERADPGGHLLAGDVVDAGVDRLQLALGRVLLEVAAAVVGGDVERVVVLQVGAVVAALDPVGGKSETGQG